MKCCNLIGKAKLIIWDEAPMMHKHCFETLDRSLRDILRSQNDGNTDIPFGGKVVVLAVISHKSSKCLDRTFIKLYVFIIVFCYKKTTIVVYISSS